MDHSLGAVDLSPTSYQDYYPTFSPNPFEQLDGVIQADPSNFQFPAATLTPNPNPSMDHSFSPQPFDFTGVEDFFVDQDGDSNGGAQPDTAPAPAEDSAAPMEIALAHPEQVNGHQGPHPARDVGPQTDIGMGKAPAEIDVNVNSLDTDGTGLNLKQKQPEPCSGGTIDLSTATKNEIMDYIRALMEHRKDKEEVPKFDDDLAQLEPWKLPVNMRDGYYMATTILDLDKKTLEGGCWKEAEFVGIRGLGTYLLMKKQYVALSRTLDFYKEDDTKTIWRMFEVIYVSVSDDGDVFLEEKYGVIRYVYQHHPSVYEFFNSDTSRIRGEAEEDNQNKGCTCTLHSDCLHHHHHTEQNNQAHSPTGKRPRTDDDPKKNKLDVWKHFTRIYIRVPKEAGSSKNKKDGKKRIYAVCNYCDMAFKSDSKQGTSHHSRHAESCMRKQSQSQPSSSKSCNQETYIPARRPAAARVV